MYCENCGKELSSTANFCPGCGTPVSGNGGMRITAPGKPFYKKPLFWIISVILIIAVVGVIFAVSGDDNSQEATVNTIAQTLPPATAAPSEAVVQTEAPTEEEADSVDLDIDTALVLVESTLKDNFENYDVTYEDDIITINVWQDGIATGTVLAAAGNQELLAAWDTIRTNQVGMNKSMMELMETIGLSHVGVAVNVLNDLDTEKILLATYNGVVIYDTLDD